MGLACGAQCVKYLLCLLNFLFFATGGVILAVSIWIAVDNTSFLLLTRISDSENLQISSAPTVMEQAAYVLIAAGGLIFLIGFLGCCGAAMESRVLLTTYGLLVVVIFVLEVAGGALAAIYRNEINSETEKFMKYTLTNFYDIPEQADSMTVTWNALMIKLKCCGVNNFTDFEYADKWVDNRTLDDVMPSACCVTIEGTMNPIDPNCTQNPTLENSYYLTGCYGRLTSLVDEKATLLLIVVAVIGVLELFALGFAFCLCSCISVKFK